MTIKIVLKKKSKVPCNTKAFFNISQLIFNKNFLDKQNHIFRDKTDQFNKDYGYQI